MENYNNENRPNYYAIIPANVRYDNRLKPNEKLLYGEITSLANKHGYCYASNKYFANLYSVNKSTVSSWISHLKELGYINIKVSYKENTKEIQQRMIFINNLLGQDNNVYIPIQKKTDAAYTKRCRGGTGKDVGGIHEITKDNNTSINNINKNNSYSQARPDRASKDPSRDLRKDIISYLNKKTNKHYRPNSNKTKALINARFNEGFKDLDDFKKVIDTKTAEWKDDPKMEKFLRPETLFGNKFEGYLNQTPKQKGYMDDKVDSYYEKLKAEEERILNGDNAEYFN